MNKQEYAEYRQTPAWREKRENCLYLYNHQCQVCGCNPTRRVIDVHHLHYRNIGNEKPEDLIPLCSVHHELIHTQPDGFNMTVLDRLRGECKENYWNDPMPTKGQDQDFQDVICAQCYSPYVPSVDNPSCEFCGSSQRISSASQHNPEEVKPSTWHSLSDMLSIRYPRKP